MRSGSTLTYLLGDHLGSTSITANNVGARVAELRYKPLGRIRYTYGTTPTTYRFTGQRADSYINLYWYGSRWYDDALGRFIQPDSIIPDPSNPADYDRYSYVRNNPLRYTDPTGHSACWDENANDIGCKSYTPTAYGLQPKDYSHSNNSNEPQNTPFDSSLGGNNDANQNGLSNQQNSKNGTKPQQQSPAAGSINEPPPFEKRAATVVFMLPFFALVDRALVTTTIANSAALVQDPEPITKLILVSSEIIIIGTDVGVSVLEISYAHWVANGDWINSWDDLSNW
jgi:RHS repeat-associated protein